MPLPSDSSPSPLNFLTQLGLTVLSMATLPHFHSTQYSVLTRTHAKDSAQLSSSAFDLYHGTISNSPTLHCSKIINYIYKSTFDLINLSNQTKSIVTHEDECTDVMGVILAASLKSCAQPSALRANDQGTKLCVGRDKVGGQTRSFCATLITSVLLRY